MNSIMAASSIFPDKKSRIISGTSVWIGHPLIWHKGFLHCKHRRASLMTWTAMAITSLWKHLKLYIVFVFLVDLPFFPRNFIVYVPCSLSARIVKELMRYLSAPALFVFTNSVT